MKKVWIIFLTIGCSLLLLGGALFTFGFGLAGWDVKALQNTQVTEKTYTEATAGALNRIALDFDVTDVKVVFSEETDKVTITYPQLQTRKGANLSEIKITETEDSISFCEKTTKWWRVSLFGTPNATATVTLPIGKKYSLSLKTDTGDVLLSGNGEFADVCVATDTGDVKFSGTFAASTLEVETDTGDVRLDNASIVCDKYISLATDTGDIAAADFTADSLKIETDTGDVKFSGNGTVVNKAEIETDTGDVRISKSLTAATVVISTDTGKVLLGNLSGASLSASTNTGDIKSLSDCVLDFTTVELITDTGDVKVSLAGSQKDYFIRAKTSTGSCNIYPTPDYSQPRKLTIRCSTGDIFASFDS